MLEKGTGGGWVYTYIEGELWKRGSSIMAMGGGEGKKRKNK